ncbi:hypothetical protein F5B19DRAFT_493865 [Rostrohypoxylon terebratum]|nr:hypothetical protein F5B19DRAFT_493865 [Rostrohypoxylon terebratum]
MPFLTGAGNNGVVAQGALNYPLPGNILPVRGYHGFSRVINVEDANGGLGQEVNAVAETVIAASPNSLEPPIEACVSYLRMEKCGTLGCNNLAVWKSPLLSSSLMTKLRTWCLGESRRCPPN